MRYVFVRHGFYGGGGLSDAEKVVKELEPHGIKGAQMAAEYISERGIVPDVVLTTKTRRTKQTADIVLERFDPPLAAPRVVRGGHSGKGVRKKLSKWINRYGLTEDQTLLFVGHGTSQASLLEFYTDGEAPPRQKWGHATVLELEVTGQDEGMEIRGLRFFPGLKKLPKKK